MATTLKMIINKAFGLNIISEVPLPELSIVSDSIDNVDIVIEYRDLFDLWEQSSKPNRYFSVKKNSVLFHVPNVAIYLIENGKNIYVSPSIGAHEDQIRLYLLGTCMGAILLQRKILPLHGSAIAINGKAYAIVGDSGAGKSTLASSLLNKGYQLLSDDVIPVTISQKGFPIVTPAYPQQKLWQESLDAFGMTSTDYRPIIERESKFAIPVSSKFSTEALPLAGVFELIKTNHDEIIIDPILKLERLHTLFYHTYRNFFISDLGLREWHFQITAGIANNVPIYRLQRPIDSFSANDLASLILNTIKKGE
ncbi:aldolase [Lederbergia wuyishanensis]|uniref:Aldolase n=1 Tax=Lederbergia wuyishanensis TaxID=1347903 RepID=A0ABU0D7P5_9BACI|nr:aldolase [Lederbergia wuyishanensis]MCJ8009108.1 aldolase [Lederbergia wuyishanensis]MDQ0344447.1 hypothetical protein [Lederbergia wuyishanensis]